VKVEGEAVKRREMATQNDASTPMLGFVTGPMLSDEQPYA
jgi:hypothetical protein